VHPVVVVLALCAAAVVAGMGSFTAIASWATDVPAELVTTSTADALRHHRRPSSDGWSPVPGAAEVDAVIGAWLGRPPPARHRTRA
jgi:hypothetical protein